MVHVMKHVIVALFFILLLISVFAYVAPTTANQPIIVESSSDFYGSDKGIVTIDLNLTGKDISAKDFFVRIKGLEDTNVLIKELSYNKQKIETIAYPVSQQSKTKLSLSRLEKKSMQIVLQFNPKQIGVGKEFIVRLETKDGTLIADLDPFLSGYTYRQQWCLNTNGISLSGNITNDHVIYFTKTSADSQFWGAVQSDGNDVRFTDESNNLFDYHFETFDSGGDVMHAWVEITTTFDSTTDTCGYMYYGNAGATNGQNEAGTYPTGYTAVWHSNNTTGNVMDSTANNHDSEAVDLATQGSATGKINGANDYEKDNTNFVRIPDSADWDFTTSDSWTLYAWIKTEGNQATIGDIIRSYGSDALFEIAINVITAGKPILYYRGQPSDSTSSCEGTTSVNDNAFHQIVGVSNKSDDKVRMFVDGTEECEATDNSTKTVNTGDQVYLGIAQDESSEAFDGIIDEARIFRIALTNDEVALLFNSENGSLVTFSAYTTGNNAPDIVVTSPTYDLNWNGTKTITFTAQDLDAGDKLDVNLFYSSVQGSTTNLIYHDANLSDGAGITCSDYNFLDSTNCSYSWDTTTTASDGYYYIDANISDGSDKDSNSSPRFTVDNTKPTTAFSGCTAGWKNTDQTITLTCTDTNSGCQATTYRVDGGAWASYSGTFNLTTDLNHQIDYNSTDRATNIEIMKTSYCAIDKTAPTVAGTTFSGFIIFGNFINGIGDIIGGAVNGAISGVNTALCEYTINGGGTWLSAVWNTDHCEKIGITISNGVIYDANTSATDNAGNTGYGTGTGQYTGDTNAPTTTDNTTNTWSITDETVTLTCNDFVGAGCKKTYYCVDSAGTCTPTTDGNIVSVTCPAGNVCLQYVRYFSQDNVDNNETVKQSAQTRIDKQNPTTTSIAITDVNGRTEDQTPTLTISATDGTGAGLKEMAFSCNGSTWGSWLAYAVSYSSFDIRTGAGCTTAYGNKTVYLKVRDNLDQESSSTNDTTILDAPVTFGDLNFFEYGVYTNNVDLTINSDLNIVWQFNATSNDLNTQSAKVYYQSYYNDVNCSGWVRNTQICGFQNESGFYQQNLAGTTFTIRSQSDDDHAYKPYTYNLPPDTMKTKSTTTFRLNDPKNWAQTVLTNNLSDKNIFMNFSFNAISTNAGIKNLEVYDCNSPQTTFPNTNCGQKTFSITTPKDPDGYFSMKNISDDQNKLNGVKLNADGNHFYYLNCPTCNVANYWDLVLIDQNSNIDRIRNQSSTTGVLNLTPNVRTFDMHTHFLDLSRNNSFTFYFTVDNNQGKTYTSNSVTEIINQTNLAPRFVDIISPLNQTYTGLVDINVTVFDPEGNALVCDFNLLETNGLVNKGVIAESISPVANLCQTDFNSLAYADTNYIVFMRVRETTTADLFSATEYGRNFKVQNTVNDPPTVTLSENNAGKIFIKDTNTVPVIFTLNDPDSSPLFISLYYSTTNVIASGSAILLTESTDGVNLVCDDTNFVSDTNCAYTWNVSSVADGNYYLSIIASDGELDANDATNATFAITTRVIPATSEYVERYIAPDSKQRDTNIFYAPTSLFALSETEKQTSILEAIQTNIFLFSIILIALLALAGWFLWKKK